MKTTTKAMTVCLLSLAITRAAASVEQESKDPQDTSKLVAALGDPNVQVRWQAANKLGEQRGDPEKIVPALAKAMKDEHWNVRYAAAQALGKFGEEARGSVRELSAALKDTIADVRWAAAGSLGEIGWPATEAFPNLKDTLGDSDAKVRSAAAAAIAKMRESLLGATKAHQEKLATGGPQRLKLVGMSAKQALASARAAGLAPSLTVGKPAPEPKYVHRVYALDVKPGVVLKRGTPVKLLIFGDVAKADK